MDVEFGNWLAGYIDGEGSFTCQVYTPRGRSSPNITARMTLGTRADEYPLLAECQAQTGLGALYFVRPTLGGPPNGRPKWTWTVANKKDCAALVKLLTEYPLRSKKHKDFKVWSEIVRLRGLTGAGRAGKLDRIKELAAELVAVRQYDPRYER
jgi:hypothetical protein